MNFWLLLARLCCGAVWCYEGLVQKILRPDAHESNIVAHFHFLGLSGTSLMMFIGALEVLLALGFWSGLLPKLVGWTGCVALLAMNLVGIFASGEIASPFELLVKNTPLWFCMALVATQGAGKWALNFKR